MLLFLRKFFSIIFHLSEPLTLVCLNNASHYEYTLCIYVKYAHSYTYNHSHAYTHAHILCVYLNINLAFINSAI